jgi:hypothetical protein
MILPCSLELTCSIVFERGCGGSKELLADVATDNTAPTIGTSIQLGHPERAAMGRFDLETCTYIVMKRKGNSYFN